MIQAKVDKENTDKANSQQNFIS